MRSKLLVRNIRVPATGPGAICADERHRSRGMRTTLFMGLLARRRREEWRERAAIFIVSAAHVACGGLTSTPNDASTVPDSTVAPDASDGSVLDAAQAQDSAPPACGDI